MLGNSLYHVAGDALPCPLMNTLKPGLFMRYIIILLCGSFLFTGCFTISAIDRAKHDRMPERVKTVLSSYKDTSGNVVIVYKKRYKKPVYKAIVPLDTILTLYRAAGKDDLLNRDSTLVNFEGVFTVQDAGNKKLMQRIVLLNDESPLTDTTGLSNEIEKNEHIAEKHKGRAMIPVKGSGLKQEIKTKAASFTIKTTNNENYFVTFQPHRRKNFRYLLVPLTVGLDAVTWPVQIVIGIIALSKVPIS